MGRPMAEHLIDAGHDTALWSHTDSKARELAAAHENARYCATPADVGKFADCIFLCVGNSAMSEEVLTGKDGVIEGVREGAVVADCSTIGPSTARRIAKKIRSQGRSLPRQPLHGVNSRRAGRHADFHDRRG